MAASVLNTPRAIQMSVFVVRAFVRLRELAVAHAALSAQLAELERRVSRHDDQFAQVIATVRKLLAAPAKPRRTIGSPPHHSHLWGRFLRNGPSGAEGTAAIASVT
jgi:hypothetical protein